MHLALRSSSVIHPGTMYDARPFLTSEDIMPPCKVQHRAKVLVDPKQTVSFFDCSVFFSGCSVLFPIVLPVVSDFLVPFSDCTTYQSFSIDEQAILCAKTPNFNYTIVSQIYKF